MHTPISATTSPPLYDFFSPSMDLEWAYRPAAEQGGDEAKFEAGGLRLASLHPPPQPHLQLHPDHSSFSLHHAYLPGIMSAPPTDQELAELQRLSDNYEAAATGPLVGQRQPSTNITTEYASADPVFQAKTAALPHKYSHYRTMRGDGRCGWRAVAFGYFEALIRLGDSNKFLEEEGRLRSLANVVKDAGFDLGLYEDFSDETFDLLRKVSDALPSGAADQVLLDAFNAEELQNYIIVHLKTLTSAWMITRQDEYAPWLLDQTVKDYTDKQVMPISSEIEHVALNALKDVFLSAAGITLEVLYLDRSEGTEVTLHRFAPVDHGAVDVGTVRLLYRPGHYDILYKLEDFRAAPNVAAFLQFDSMPLHDVCTDIGVADLLTTIPGISHACNWSSATGYDAVNTPYDCTAPRQHYPTLSSPTSTQLQTTYRPSSLSQSGNNVQDLAFRSIAYGSSPLPNTQDQTATPFRPSAWELKQDFAKATSQKPLQTSIFQNSYYNTAHFLNPDFQPEEWRPDDEGCVKAPRHRHSC